MERKKAKFGEVVQRPPSFSKEIFLGGWRANLILLWCGNDGRNGHFGGGVVCFIYLKEHLRLKE